jgi:competence protein ComEC
MGLVYISPLLMEKVLRRTMNGVLIMLIENGVTTISAIMATLPLILFQFGRLSLVAPIVNVLILWTIPYIMLFGFIATLVGMVSVPLGIVVAVPSVALMEYILHIVGWFGTQIFASLDIAVPWWGMIGLYCLLIYGVLRWSRLSRSCRV